MGTTFYDLGKYDEALAEFNKVLAVDPTNSIAKRYVDKIFKESLPSEKSSQSSEKPAETRAMAEKPEPSREDVMNSTLNDLGNSAKSSDKSTTKGRGYSDSTQDNTINPMGEGSQGIKAGPFTVSGEIQARAGFTSKDSIWRRANWDLNEKNWRILSSDGLNNRVNSYDPRIYDRLNVNLDTNKSEKDMGLAFHSNVTIDPWSFTGKSEKTTVNSAFGDTADVQIKYIAGTQYTLNQTVKTNKFGNTVNIP